jgi:hypothetical protein
MKSVLAALAAACAFGFGGVAFAQAAGAAVCPAAPTPPTLPDGATAKGAEMNAGNKAYNTWAVAAKARLDCVRKGIETLETNTNVAQYVEAVAKLKAVQDTPEVKDYGAKVSAYNAEAEKMNAISESWKKSGETYNARVGAKKKP